MFSSDILKRSRLNIPEYYNLPELEIVEVRMPSRVSVTEKAETINIDENEIINRSKAEAKIIIADAQEKAKAAFGKAIREAEAICKEKYNLAYENGFKEGFEAGKAEAQQKVQVIIDELTEISHCLSTEKQEIAEANQELILDLGAEIAQKVAGDYFVKNEEMFKAVFNRALKELRGTDRLTVTVSEKDYNIMTYDPRKLLDLSENFRTVEIVSNKNADEGTLKLETPVMLLDAGLETQIGIIKKNIEKTI